MKSEKFKSIFIPVSVFVSGMTVLMLEITSSRLVAPYFGNSVLVWAVLISLTLLFLTVGYYLGGLVADRHPDLKTYCTVILIVALYVFIMPYLAGPFQGFLIKKIPDLPALGLSVLFILGLPCVLLGGVSPFAIRLLVRDVEHSGRLAGSVYALSTAGSIIGAIIPVILGIPHVGTRMTIIIFNSLLFITALVGLGSAWLLVAGVALIVGGMFVQNAFAHKDPSILCRKETPYGYYLVSKNPDGSRSLLVNDRRFVYSDWKSDGLIMGRVMDNYLLAPYFLPYDKAQQMEDVLILGLAGGTSVGQLNQLFKGLRFDGVEIDKGLIEIGKKYFYLDAKNLNIINMDARRYLLNTDKKYDLVIIDTFQGDIIPTHLVTVEFFTLLKAHLKPDGIMVANLPPEFSKRGGTTLRHVFPSVYNCGMVFIASDSENFSAVNYLDNTDKIKNSELLRFLHSKIEKKRLEIHYVKKQGEPFIDDRPPLLLRYRK